jgi:hypothetical protein
MSPDDERAANAGKVTAAIALSVLGAAALLLLAAAEGWRWAPAGLGVSGLVLLAVWSMAWFEMARHQRRTASPEADREAWQRRMWPTRARGLAFLAGALVPWFYLLGSPAQRRLASYARRRPPRGR